MHGCTQSSPCVLLLIYYHSVSAGNLSVGVVRVSLPQLSLDASFKVAFLPSISQ